MAAQAVPYLLGLAGLAIVSGLLFGPWGSGPALMLGAFVLYFFRDPERRSPAGEGLVVSPADGKVTAVERRPDGTRVSIFLSVFDCHINRAPVTGVVASARHTPGRFRPAWDPRVSHENERNHLVIQAADGEYGLTQIAGVLARRIVCRKRPGDSVSRGERIGLIQFGSRTDLHLPAGLEPEVRVGERVRGAVTILARRTAARRAGEQAAAGIVA